jgi:hypothetical protein
MSLFVTLASTAAWIELVIEVLVTLLSIVLATVKELFKYISLKEKKLMFKFNKTGIKIPKTSNMNAAKAMKTRAISNIFNDPALSRKLIRF